MEKKTLEWKNLELLVSEIQKQLAPEAEVKHNHQVKGKSGRIRKLDVSISQIVSTFPVFIVFDCKLHKNPVKMSYVESFSGQLEDVGANLGVMVSSSGFDDGAKAVAKLKRIILQTYRKAGETDWKELIGKDSWVVLTRVELNQENAIVYLIGNPTPMEVPFNTSIYDENGEILVTLEDAFVRVWKEMGIFIGEITSQASFEELPSFIKIDNGLVQIQNATLKAQASAKKYLVNLNMAEGNVIEDIDSGKPVYRSVASNGFDWEEIINNQPGIEINNEEFHQIMSRATGTADLSHAKRYVRFVFEEKLVKKD